MKEKIKAVTKEDWESINPITKQMVEEYLDNLV